MINEFMDTGVELLQVIMGIFDIWHTQLHFFEFLKDIHHEGSHTLD